MIIITNIFASLKFISGEITQESFDRGDYKLFGKYRATLVVIRDDGEKNISNEKEAILSEMIGGIENGSEQFDATLKIKYKKEELGRTEILAEYTRSDPPDSVIRSHEYKYNLHELKKELSSSVKQDVMCVGVKQTDNTNIRLIIEFKDDDLKLKNGSYSFNVMTLETYVDLSAEEMHGYVVIVPCKDKCQIQPEQ